MAYRNIDTTLDGLQLQTFGVISFHYDFIHHYMKNLYVFAYDIVKGYDQYMKSLLGIEDEEESYEEETEE